MDERQQQVQVGAGLQESRLNTEFIDFLRKYGTYGLYGLLAVVLAYVGWQKWSVYQQKNLDEAFRQLDAGMASRNPENLLTVAAENKGQGAVWQLATLSAAENYLDAARRGYAPGSDQVNPAETDRLTESQTQEMLNKANGLLKDVLAKVGNDKGQLLIAQRTRWNLATAALNANDPATAKKYLDEYENAAKNAGLTDMVALGSTRASSIDRVLAPTALYTEAELPATAKPAAPVQVPGMGTFNVTGGTGRPISLTREEFDALQKEGKIKPLDGQDPNAVPGQPAPAPAPTEPGSETPPPPKTNFDPKAP